MCIIVYKPKGFNLPDNSIIRNCMINNPDGAGYMFNVPGQGVYVKKGFESHKILRKNLLSKLEEYNLKVKDISIVIHARIATAGIIKAENCHPFPVTDNIGLLQATEILFPSAMAHNGIINISDKNHKNLSDTQIFIKDVLSKIPEKELRLEHNKKMLDLALSGSKIILFNEQGLFLSVGEWIKHDGIYYSNENYKQRKVVYNSKWYDKYEENYHFSDYYGYSAGKSNKDKRYKTQACCDMCGDLFDMNELISFGGSLLCESCDWQLAREDYQVV